MERLERVGPLLVVLAHAAASEPALAELYRRVHETRLQNLRNIAVALAHRDALRVGEEEAAETVWALASPELHTLLTRLRGWSRERYIAWLAETLAGALPRRPRSYSGESCSAIQALATRFGARVSHASTTRSPSSSTSSSARRGMRTRIAA